MTDLSQLNSALSNLNRNIASVDDRVSAVQVQVGGMAGDIAATSAELTELRKDFHEFVVTAERVANVQRSETKLGNLKSDLDREFGHYELVRRSSIGTLQAFDLGIVSNASVQQVSEELMIQSPRYWLAPALVALAAWSRDDESLAGKAVEAAYSRDPAKTSLFFSLVLRRQGRLDAASRWLRHYFASLDPRALGREFAVVLESVAQEGFGPSGRDLVLGTLVDWSTLLRDDDRVVEEQIDRWRAEISTLRGTVDDEVYPALSGMSPQWDSIKDSLEHASALGFTAAKYEAVYESAPTRKQGLEDQMDELLETLVTEYDREELPHRREVLYHEAVLEHGGDLTRAREAADAEVQALDETLDAVSLITHAALHPQRLGVSGFTQKLAIGAGRSDFDTAVGRFTSAYRAAHLDRVDIVLGAQHSNYAVTYGFRGWTTGTDVPQNAAERSLKEAWDSALKSYIDKMTFKNSSMVLPIAVAAVVTLIVFLIGGSNPVPGIVALLAAGGIAAVVILRKKSAADKAVAAAEAAKSAAYQHSRDLYGNALAEWVDSQIEYADRDADEKRLRELIERWPSARLHAGEVA